MKEIDYDPKELKDRRLKDLAVDHRRLNELMSRTDKISYEVTKQKEGEPPTEYIIHYKVKSIIGVDKDQKPIYGHSHKARISFPNKYPNDDPNCYMITGVWHPNIRQKKGKQLDGKICLNDIALGAWHRLPEAVKRIGQILQYKNYWAKSGLPEPIDLEVATWVLKYGEPGGYMDKDNGIAVDPSTLLNADEGVDELPPIVLESEIEIKDIRFLSDKGSSIPPSDQYTSKDDDDDDDIDFRII